MPSTPEERHKQLRERFREGSSHERLRAARELEQHAKKADIAIIRELLAGEKVSFVKRALSQTLERLETGRVLVPDDSAVEEEGEPDRHAYTQAVEWVTGTLLHEILPRVGSIELEAQRSVENYRDSKLKAKIDNLSWLLEGVEELRKATISRVVTEFTVADVINKNVAAIDPPESVTISLEGRTDIVAVGDPSLVSIALCNGLRNAVEACAGREGQSSVAVSWGETEVDYWITVIDDGPGFAGTPEAAFEVGRSTKRGHRGFGLAIARQAMTTMAGSVSLKPNTPTGVVFELRWFR